MWYLYLLAILAGFAITMQAPINGQLGGSLGHQPIIAALISFIVGMLSLAMIALFKGNWTIVWTQLPHQPLWRYTGGLLGAFMVFASAFLTPKLGVTNFLFIVIVTQLLTATAIDHFGWIGMPSRPADMWKIAGLFVTFIGLGLFFFGKRLFS